MYLGRKPKGCLEPKYSFYMPFETQGPASLTFLSAMIASVKTFMVTSNELRKIQTNFFSSMVVSSNIQPRMTRNNLAKMLKTKLLKVQEALRE